MRRFVVVGHLFIQGLVNFVQRIVTSVDQQLLLNLVTVHGELAWEPAVGIDDV